MRTRFLAVASLAVFLVSCGSSSRQTRSEIEGTQETRVERITAILSAKTGTLPGPILDAHMVEDVMDNSGGLVAGPSDIYVSGVLRFAPEDLSKWRGLLAPQIQPPVPPQSYYSPRDPPAWWPAKEAFDGCEYYAPDKLTGRMGGILALSPAESAIYFSCF